MRAFFEHMRATQTRDYRSDRPIDFNWGMSYFECRQLDDLYVQSIIRKIIADDPKLAVYLDRILDRVSRQNHILKWQTWRALQKICRDAGVQDCNFWIMTPEGNLAYI